MTDSTLVPDPEPTPSSNMSIVDRVASMGAKARTTMDLVKHGELQDKHQSGQLMFWPPEHRALPNEFARCSIFSVENKNAPRKIFMASKPHNIPIMGGGGYIAFWGEKLRQDDLTVWLQLMHLFKEAKAEWISFTPYSFLKSIDWEPNTRAYQRLHSIIRRLAGANIEVYSKTRGRGLNTRLLQNYEFSSVENSNWRVRLYDEKDQLLFMFENNFSRLHWEQRKSLPEGLATWLHTFFSTHKEPYALRVVTIAEGAGLKLVDELDAELDEAARTAIQKKRLRECKRLIDRALEELVKVGFLQSYEITKTGLVKVRVQ